MKYKFEDLIKMRCKCCGPDGEPYPKCGADADALSDKAECPGCGYPTTPLARAVCDAAGGAP